MTNTGQEIRLQLVPSEFVCEICTEGALTQFENSNRCTHPFCTHCMINYIRVQLNDNNVAEIPCPALNCDHTLDPVACASAVGPSLFVRWCDVLCESAISGFDKSYCPDRNCGVLIVNECGREKEAKCPSCKKLFCFECKKVWHGGRPCEDNLGRRDVTDVYLGNLLEQKELGRCPQCRVIAELIDGCSVVKCRCGMSFCIKCGKQASGHACSCIFRQFTLGMWLVFLTIIILAFLALIAIIYGIITLGILLFNRLYILFK